MKPRLARSARLQALLFLCCLGAPGGSPQAQIVVGSKNFAENRFLAELFAQTIEHQTALTVQRRLGLAGTQVCFEALRSGAIDLYPEYTGTGLVTILGESPNPSADATLRMVRFEFLHRWGLQWMAPLSFENAYAVAVPRAIAEQYDLHTISDLANVAASLHAAFGYEFLERPDGLPGLRELYGLRFASVRGMQQALKYQAAGERRIDCLDVYSTDGRLVVHDLVILQDDRNFFPPYHAAALVRQQSLEKHPEVAAALSLLSGTLSEERMRQFNMRLENDGEPVERVAADALRELGLIADSPQQAAAPRRQDRSLLPYLWSNRHAIGRHCLRHLWLAASGLLLGMLVAIPLALWLERRQRWAEALIRLIGTSQTIPSLALLAFMVPICGIGAIPAILALWVYAIFPILRSTYTGVRHAHPPAVLAATALGMTPRQVLLQVRLPLAAPVILAGIRTAAVLTVGTATLAAFIGAGGLGEPIVAGVQAVDTTLILSGALPAALLAILVDVALGFVENRLRPPAPQHSQEA
jgi:osmoprotectant transport system permease protein